MTLPSEVDVLVIGAGPAGLAAATELARDFNVLVVDREKAAGGIPRHCGHYPFGMREFHRVMKGPDYARALAARAEAAGVRFALGVNVVALHPGPSVTVTSDEGVTTISARRVLIATGVRESSRAQRLIGGTKPGGVVNTGALQGMVYLEHARPFRRPVILGTELVSFSAIMTCAHAGIRPVAMVDSRRATAARWPSCLYPRIKGIPLYLSTKLVSIEGRERVESVIIDGPKGRKRIETDGVIVSGHFRSESTLIVTSHLARDPGTGGPAVDSAGRCSDPTYYAAGNMLHPVETAGWCWSEGRRVGLAIARDLKSGLPAERAPVTVESDALAWVVPQFVSPEQALDRLQLRVNRPVNGRLSVRVDGREVASRRIWTRPDRRITLPMPSVTGQVSIHLEE